MFNIIIDAWTIGAHLGLLAVCLTLALPVLLLFTKG